jgi:drebrin-like protein
VADASGSKYSAASAPPPVAATKPAVASKPVFTPTQSSGGSAGFNPLARSRVTTQRDTNVDADGWGDDAPPVTRTQLEKVQPAYKPTRVDMRELTGQSSGSSGFNGSRNETDSRPGVIGGAYQPVGKVDIAAIRRQARESGSTENERPEIVRGSYEPVGKVDIAAIRARAQKSPDTFSAAPQRVSPAATGGSAEESAPSLASRSAAFSGPERLTSLPKPKVANKFGGSSFAGTKAPLPGGFEAKTIAPTAPVGTASRTFADQGGKTPAQIWAEKKARERGTSGSGDVISPSGNVPQSPMKAQTSGGGEWKSGYAGKTWAPVQTTHTGKSAGSSVEQQRTGDVPTPDEESVAPTSPSGGIASLRDRFSGAPPMGAPMTSFDRPAPEPDTSNKPNRGIPIPGMPMPPTPEMQSASPIRIAMPVGRGAVTDVHEEQMSPPPPIMPARPSDHDTPEPEDDEPETGPDPARAAAQTTAAAAFSHEAEPATPPITHAGGQRAKAEYDYEAAEDNEVSLREGEIVTNVDKVDPDWWVVTNEKGQSGLVPSNYLSSLPEDDAGDVGSHAVAPDSSATTAPVQTPAISAGPSATALYDYEAAGMLGTQ